MNSSAKIILPAMLLFLFVCRASAADLRSLDRVSVLMPKSQVLTILGAPDMTLHLTGLMVDLYAVSQAGPLVSAGYFYEKDLILAGHSFIFQGSVAAEAEARMKDLGFTVLEEKRGSARLAGKDDDTGRPIIVTIGQTNDLTTVTTFEKGFYDRHNPR